MINVRMNGIIRRGMAGPNTNIQNVRNVNVFSANTKSNYDFQIETQFNVTIHSLFTFNQKQNWMWCLKWQFYGLPIVKIKLDVGRKRLNVFSVHIYHFRFSFFVINLVKVYIGQWWIHSHPPSIRWHGHGKGKGHLVKPFLYSQSFLQIMFWWLLNLTITTIENISSSNQLMMKIKWGWVELTSGWENIQV